MEDNNNKIKSRYQFKEHDEESLKDYNDFMKVYVEKHKCCPVCGSESCRMTMMGYPLHSDRRDEYKDLNRCTCDCGSVHTRHDQISVEEFNEKKIGKHS